MTNIYSKKNKILFITPSYKPAFNYGGTIISVAALVESMTSYFDCVVYTSNADGNKRLDVKSQEIVNGVEVHYFHSVIAGNIHFAPSLLWALFKDRKSNIVHVHSWWNLVAICSCLIALFKGNRLIVSPRGMLSPYSLRAKIFRNLFQKVLGNWILSKATIHATSEQEQMQLQSLHKNWKVVCIPNILPLLPQRTVRSVNSDVFNLVFVARIHPKKNLESIIKVLQYLPNIQFTIVGDGVQEYIMFLKNLAVEYNCQSQIVWHGPEYDVNRKADLLSNASLFVLLSHDENFANNVVEALMCNCPVLISSNVGVAPFVEAHKLGWIYNESDSNLVEVLKQIQNDTSRREDISSRARQIVIDTFLSKNTIDKYIALYE